MTRHSVCLMYLMNCTKDRKFKSYWMWQVSLISKFNLLLKERIATWKQKEAGNLISPGTEKPDCASQKLWEINSLVFVVLPWRGRRCECIHIKLHSKQLVTKLKLLRNCFPVNLRDGNLHLGMEKFLPSPFPKLNSLQIVYKVLFSSRSYTDINSWHVQQRLA